MSYVIYARRPVESANKLDADIQRCMWYADLTKRLHPARPHVYSDIGAGDTRDREGLQALRRAVTTDPSIDTILVPLAISLTTRPDYFRMLFHEFSEHGVDIIDVGERIEGIMRATFGGTPSE